MLCSNIYVRKSDYNSFEINWSRPVMVGVQFRERLKFSLRGILQIRCKIVQALVRQTITFLWKIFSKTHANRIFSLYGLKRSPFDKEINFRNPSLDFLNFDFSRFVDEVQIAFSIKISLPFRNKFPRWVVVQPVISISCLEPVPPIK